ncbi:MAG: TetR/AcrR family transcriptional regulator [Eggerthellaceae bacterium]|nr:TetR/AcrR family transcriptional regulator [Eggerthellaceae bacterium]
MANDKDPRYARTEAAIRSAFLELVRDAPVASVTASSVCRKAGISRNAFYLHHSGVAALYVAMVDELLADVREACLAFAGRVSASGDVNEGFMSLVLAALARHEGLLRALLPSDDGAIAKRLADGMADAYVEASLVLSGQGDSLENRLRCTFSTWALMGFMQRWLSLTDRPIPEMLPNLEEFHAGVLADAMRYLTGSDDL